MKDIYSFINSFFFNIPFLKLFILDKLLIIFTAFAHPVFLVPSCLVGYLYINKLHFKFITAVLCLSTIINQTIKYSTRIPRPNFITKTIIHDPFSFPSGDVQVLSTFIFLLYFTYKKGNILFCGIPFLFCICFFRIYSGAHYFLDTFFGIIFGLIIAFIAIKLSNSFHSLCFIMLPLAAYLIINKQNYPMTTIAYLIFGCILISELYAKFYIKSN